MKSVFNYRKPAFWIFLIALVTCVVVVICFIANSGKDGKENTTTAQNTEKISDSETNEEPDRVIEENKPEEKVEVQNLTDEKTNKIFADYAEDPGLIIGKYWSAIFNKYGNPSGALSIFGNDIYTSENGDWLILSFDEETLNVDQIKTNVDNTDMPEIAGYSFNCTDKTVFDPDTGWSNDSLVLIFNSDGSFTYSQPSYSSYVPVGNWYVQENMLITREDKSYKYFEIIDGNLVFRQKWLSSAFVYYAIEDGMVFEKGPLISDLDIPHDPVVTFDDLEDNEYLQNWVNTRSGEIMLTSYHYLGNTVSERISLALYLDDSFVMDFPKTGHPVKGHYFVNQNGLVLTSYDEKIKLVFDIEDEPESFKKITKSGTIRINAGKSSDGYEELGLSDEMEFKYFQAHSGVRLDGYSEIAIPQFDVTEDNSDICGRYFITTQEDDSMPTFTISRYKDGKLTNRISLLNLGIGEFGLYEKTVNETKYLYLTVTFTSTVYEGKTFDYEITMKNGIMVVSYVDKESPMLSFDQNLSPKWNLASAVINNAER